MKRWLSLFVMYCFGIPMGVGGGIGLFYTIKALDYWIGLRWFEGFLWFMILIALLTISLIIGYLIQVAVLFAAELMRDDFSKLTIFISGLLSYGTFVFLYFKSPIRDVLKSMEYSEIFILSTFFITLAFFPAVEFNY